MKFVPTVFSARQFINHGHVKVNGKKVNISSYQVSEGDLIEVKDKSREMPLVLLAIESAERDVPDATITTFADALWWVLTTITTVGYGDRYPVTTEGRLVAAGLMIAGIAVLGTVTATIASWFTEQIQRSRTEAARHDEPDPAGPGTPDPATWAELLAELRRLRSRLDELEAATRWRDEARATLGQERLKVDAQLAAEAKAVGVQLAAEISSS